MSEEKQTPEPQNVPPQPVEEQKPVEQVVEKPVEKPVESKDWYKQMLEEAGEDKRYFDKYKDKDSAKKGILSALQLVGKKGDIPKEDASDDERSTFWNKLGADKIEVKVPEFGEDYGEVSGDLNQYYGNVTKEISEIAKAVVPKSKGINDAIEKIVLEFSKRDAERLLKNHNESKAQAEEVMNKIAKKSGLSTEQVKTFNKEIMNRFGWGDNTTMVESFTEALLELHKATTNSQVMKDAYLHNTNEGIEHQLAELKADPNWGMDTPKGKELVKKRIELLEKMGSFKKRS